MVKQKPRAKTYLYRLALLGVSVRHRDLQKLSGVCVVRQLDLECRRGLNRGHRRSHGGAGLLLAVHLHGRHRRRGAVGAVHCLVFLQCTSKIICCKLAFGRKHAINERNVRQGLQSPTVREQGRRILRALKHTGYSKPWLTAKNLGISSWIF